MATSTRVIPALELIRQLWAQAQLPRSVLENTIQLGHVVLPHEGEQGVRSSLQLTPVAQACCAAVALAERLRRELLRIEASGAGAEEVERLVLDEVQVDARHALAEYAGWTRLHAIWASTGSSGCRGYIKHVHCIAGK